MLYLTDEYIGFEHDAAHKQQLDMLYLCHAQLKRCTAAAHKQQLDMLYLMVK